MKKRAEEPKPSRLFSANDWRPATKLEYQNAAPGERAIKDVGLERYYYVRKTA